MPYKEVFHLCADDGILNNPRCKCFMLRIDIKLAHDTAIELTGYGVDIWQ